MSSPEVEADGLRLILEYLDPDTMDMQGLATAVADAVPQIPDPGKVQIVWTGDLAASITDRTEGTEPYEPERLGGRASAMTFPREGGEAIVVLDAWPYAKREVLDGWGINGDLDIVTATGRQALRHEVWHVAIHQRGEWTGNIRTRLGLGEGATGLFNASAGVAAEEYRVERELWDSGAPIRVSYSHNLVEVLESVGVALTGAIQPWRETSPEETWTVLCRDVHQLVTRFGYVAAEWWVTGAEPPPDVSESTAWRALLPGSTWAKITAAFRDFPGAGTPCPLLQLDDASRQLASTIAGWTVCLGLDISDRESGVWVGFDPAREGAGWCDKFLS